MTDASGGAGDQGGQAGGGQQGTGSGAAGGNAGANNAPWHANIDQGIKDFWAAKKYDLSDPVKVLDVVSRSYQGAERLLGVPADELLRMPKPNADTTEVNAFWNRIGVPKEAKDYDFAAVKMADGSDLDPAFLDTMRASLHANRVPKDNAPAVIRDVIKYLEANDRAEAAETTAEVQRQEQALRTNWGNRYAYNLTVAKDALDRIGQAAGLNKQQIDQGWDALSKLGGVGAAAAMEMLRVIGSRMGEHDFVAAGQSRPAGDGGFVSADQARAEIASLLQDRDFQARLLAGNVEAKRKWTNLHQILTGVQTVAA